MSNHTVELLHDEHGKVQTVIIRIDEEATDLEARGLAQSHIAATAGTDIVVMAFHGPEEVTTTGPKRGLVRYEGIVYSRNLNPDHGTPVSVLAQNRQDAINRVVEVGWGGPASEARVCIDRITE